MDKLWSIEVVAAGPLLTVQDRGRPTARRYGVPAGGAMDGFALDAANQLVGNPPTAAALEITAGGVELRFLRPGLIALTGGDLTAQIDQRPLPLWTAVPIDAGQHLRLRGRTAGWGARAYLALSGGLDVPDVLGSRSTNLGSGFGGLEGRPLRRGDRLAIMMPAAQPAPLIGRHWPTTTRPEYRREPLLRFVPGPHLDCLPAESLAIMGATTLQINPTSNRMGYRLDGTQLPHVRPCSLPSLGVIPGVIQVPPDGTPILLMADAQTTGGYPVAGVVISADLPLAAQLLPGDRLRLALTTPEAARTALATLQQYLRDGPEPSDEGEPLTALAGAPAILPEITALNQFRIQNSELH